MKVIISTVIGNNTVYIKEVFQTADPLVFGWFFTHDKKLAHDFETKEGADGARSYCTHFERQDPKHHYHIETIPEQKTQPVLAGTMDAFHMCTGKAMIFSLLLFVLSSCSVRQYQVTKVNGSKFKVAGHRGTFISPKDSVITIGQWVPVKN